MGLESLNSEYVNGMIHKVVKDRMLDGLNDEIEERGIKAIHDRAGQYFERLNMNPVFIQEGEEDFAEMREKLNTEPGFVVSNHPGYVDAAVIMRCIDREDVKIMIRESHFEKMKELIGEKYLVPASKNGNKAISIIREAKRHVEEGGLYVLFPSGGSDIDDINFQEGLPFLLNQVAPETMVYNFYLNEDDVRNIRGEMTTRHVGLASSLVFDPGINPNRLLEKKYFRVDEVYTTAKEWQEKLKQGGKNERRQISTDYYKKIFGI